MPSLEMIVSIVFRAGLVPWAAAVICAVAVGRLSRQWQWSACPGGLVFPLAFLCGYDATRAGPLLPEEFWHWLPHVPLAFASVWMLGEACSLPRWVSGGLYAVVAAGGAYLLTPAFPGLAETHHWWWAGLAAVLALQPWIARRAGETSFAWVPSLGLGFAMAAGAFVVLQSGNARMTELCLAATASLAGLLMAAWWRQVPRLFFAALPSANAALLGILSVACHYNSALPRGVFFLVALSPWGLLCGQVIFATGNSHVRAAIVQLTGMATPVIAALVWTAIS